MSVETPQRAARYEGGYSDYEDRHGQGWVTFAGVMLAIIGTLNVIGGIGAIDNSHFYAGNAHYIFSDLNTWGWVVLLTGSVQVLAAFGIWARNQFARWLGVGFASLNCLAQLLMIPASPFWSLALFAVDVMIIYGLIAYGGKDQTA
jgi:hypothetical protein